MCSEDCKFCAQSKHYNADIKKYPFVHEMRIKDFIKNNENNTVHRISFVTSGKKLVNMEIKKLAALASNSSTNKNLCGSLGTLNENELQILKDAGFSRYHHNLETSRNFYNKICTTHDYDERVKTVERAKEMGFSVCCGGIFGMGESDKDILDLANELKLLNIDSIPINFLNPIKGTPFENYNLLSPEKCLKIIAFFRFYFPDKDILVCGGRTENMRHLHENVFDAGASGIMTGNYLTRKGRFYSEDIQMIKRRGYRVL
jgi:biotin synthase